MGIVVEEGNARKKKGAFRKIKWEFPRRSKNCYLLICTFTDGKIYQMWGRHVGQHITPIDIEIAPNLLLVLFSYYGYLSGRGQMYWAGIVQEDYTIKPLTKEERAALIDMDLF